MAKKDESESEAEGVRGTDFAEKKASRSAWVMESSEEEGSPEESSDLPLPTEATSESDAPKTEHVVAEGFPSPENLGGAPSSPEPENAKAARKSRSRSRSQSPAVTTGLAKGRASWLAGMDAGEKGGASPKKKGAGASRSRSRSKSFSVDQDDPRSKRKRSTARSQGAGTPRQSKRARSYSPDRASRDSFSPDRHDPRLDGSPSKRKASKARTPSKRFTADESAIRWMVPEDSDPESEEKGESKSEKKASMKKQTADDIHCLHRNDSKQFNKEEKFAAEEAAAVKKAKKQKGEADKEAAEKNRRKSTAQFGRKTERDGKKEKKDAKWKSDAKKRRKSAAVESDAVADSSDAVDSESDAGNEAKRRKKSLKGSPKRSPSSPSIDAKKAVEGKAPPVAKVDRRQGNEQLKQKVGSMFGVKYVSKEINNIACLCVDHCDSDVVVKLLNSHKPKDPLLALYIVDSIMRHARDRFEEFHQILVKFAYQLRVEHKEAQKATTTLKSWDRKQLFLSSNETAEIPLKVMQAAQAQIAAGQPADAKPPAGAKAAPGAKAGAPGAKAKAPPLTPEQQRQQQNVNMAMMRKQLPRVLDYYQQLELGASSPDGSVTLKCVAERASIRGSAARHGGMATNEDRSLITNMVDIPGFSGCLLSVIDGHSGEAAADHVLDHKVLYLQRRLRDMPKPATREKMEEVAKASCKDVEDHFVKLARENSITAGCVAAFCLLWFEEERNNFTMTGYHIGDVRLVLMRSNEVFALTTDHHPDRPDEKARIESMGGIVHYTASCPRVLPKPDPTKPAMRSGLAVSRAFGDISHKDPPVVSAEPEVFHMDSKTGDRLVLASDGIWNVVTEAEACLMAFHWIRANRKDPFSSAESLLQNCLERLSTDDKTCVVAKVTINGDGSRDETTMRARRYRSPLPPTARPPTEEARKAYMVDLFGAPENMKKHADELAAADMAAGRKPPKPSPQAPAPSKTPPPPAEATAKNGANPANSMTAPTPKAAPTAPPKTASP